MKKKCRYTPTLLNVVPVTPMSHAGIELALRYLYRTPKQPSSYVTIDSDGIHHVND